MRAEQIPFNCSLAAVSSNKTDTTIKLKMSNKDAAKFAQHFLGSLDKEVIVQFGDPQMQFDLDDETMSRSHAGSTYQVLSSGTVENVRKDEQQTDLFDQPAAEFGVEVESEATKPADDEENSDSMEGDTEEAIESGDFEDEIGFGEDPDVVGQEETELGDLQDEKTEEPSELETAQVDKDSIEEYILKERPSFPDLPYDFPNLLEGKREGNTWIQLANYLGILSTQLQRAWSEYKKRVKGLMGAA